MAGILATWQPDVDGIPSGSLVLVDEDDHKSWIACEHPVSVRHFRGVAAGLGY